VATDQQQTEKPKVSRSGKLGLATVPYPLLCRYDLGLRIQQVRTLHDYAEVDLTPDKSDLVQAALSSLGQALEDLRPYVSNEDCEEAKRKVDEAYRLWVGWAAQDKRSRRAMSPARALLDTFLLC
jgi:hypothetical protein